MNPLALILALAVVGCRLELREPTGTAVAGDELALQEAVREIYRALASSDTLALDSVAVPAATIALPGPEQGDGFLVPLYTLWSVPGLRVGDQALRVVRTELHPDSHVAVVRVMLATRLAGALTDSEGSDWLTFVRREQGWSLVHAALGSWRGRSLP